MAKIQKKPIESFEDSCTIIDNQSEQDMYFLHGFGSNKEDQLNRKIILSELERENNQKYNYIYCDAIGHGQSYKKGNHAKFHWKETVEEYDKLITKRNKETILIGHSMGATEAISLGLMNEKVKKVFAIAGIHGKEFLKIPQFQYLGLTLNGIEKKEIDNDEIFTEINKGIKPALPDQYNYCTKSDKNKKKCHKQNKTKFYLIHSTKDTLVPIDQFEKNKRDLQLDEENVLVFHESVPKNYISHITPILYPKTLQFIKKKLQE